jgi:hypothetical protein
VRYVRTAKTKSGAAAVEFVYLSRRGSLDIEHAIPALAITASVIA